MQRVLRHTHPHVTKDRDLKAFDPAVIEAMERLQATVEALEASPAKFKQASTGTHAKLLEERRGEMAEWLKAAVC